MFKKLLSLATVSLMLAVGLSLAVAPASNADVPTSSPYVMVITCSGSSGILFYNAASTNPISSGSTIAESSAYFSAPNLTSQSVSTLGAPSGCAAYNGLPSTGTYSIVVHDDVSADIGVAANNNLDNVGTFVLVNTTKYVLFQTSGSLGVAGRAYEVTVSAPAVATPVPDPVQQSKITGLSVATAVAKTLTPVVVSGSFVEKISNISLDNTFLVPGSWVQTPTTVSFTLPGKSTGTYLIQIYNGSAPVLNAQSFTFIAPVASATSVATKPAKVTYIRCVKPDRGIRIYYGINPSCPVGYTFNN